MKNILVALLLVLSVNLVFAGDRDRDYRYHRGYDRGYYAPHSNYYYRGYDRVYYPSAPVYYEPAPVVVRETYGWPVFFPIFFFHHHR